VEISSPVGPAEYPGDQLLRGVGWLLEQESEVRSQKSERSGEPRGGVYSDF
jgi:hypothetical protein